MKRRTFFLWVVGVVGVIALVLVTNKRATLSKTRMIEDLDGSVAVRSTVVRDSVYTVGFEANGVLSASHDLSLVSDAGGRVLEVLVREGDVVRKGQVLIRLDSETLRADVESARVAYEASQKDYERYKNANAQGGVTDQQLAAIHTQMVAAESRYVSSRRRLSDAAVKSPMSGKVYKKYVEVGSYLNPGAKLFDILDDSALKVMSALTEKQRIRTHVGDSVRLTSELYPETRIGGVVAFVSDKADRTLNFPVEVRITDSPVELLPGMYVTIAFVGESQREGLLVPHSAITGGRDDAYLYTIKGGKAIKTPVVTGDMLGSRVEVLSGLQQGDSIVLEGLINISDGTPVKSVQ